MSDGVDGADALLLYRFAADVRHVRRVAINGAELVLIHSGSSVQAIGADGSTEWARHDLGVERVVGVMEGSALLVATCADSVLVTLDARTGDTVWTLTAPGAEPFAPSSVLISADADETLLVVSPPYTATVRCFTMSTHGVVERWTIDLSATIDAGFGPAMVTADLLGLGGDQLVISSRRGTTYGGDERPATERLVLGREDGRLFQAVIDLTTGRILQDVAYEPDPGGYPAARPYGLLQAGLSAGGDIALVSCQVEEFAAVTAVATDNSVDARLSSRWTWFVEKDWPEDLQELRPQRTSIARVAADARPRLVVGYWDAVSWRTRVIDVLGSDATGSVMDYPDAYFWGTADLDGDGVAEIITSVEGRRRLGGQTVVNIVSHATGRIVDRLDDAMVLPCVDPELPPHIVFNADGAGAALLSNGAGRTGVVVLRGGRTMWWTLGQEPVTLLDEPVVRVDARPGTRALTTARGEVVLLDDRLRPERRISPQGASVRLIGEVGTATHASVAVLSARGSVLVVSTRTSATASVGGEPVPIAWDATTCTIFESGGRTMVAIGRATGEAWTLTVAALDAASAPAATWAVPGVVSQLLHVGEPPALIASMRTGPHSSRMSAYTLAGEPLWHDEASGAHGGEAAVFADRDRWRVAYDDHGLLRVRDAHSGDLLWHDDWTAAYTSPLAVSVGGAQRILRTSGAHGMEMLSPMGERLWRRNYPLFEIYGSPAAVLTIDGRTLIAVPRRLGRVDIVDAADGVVHSTWDVGRQSVRRPVVAYDAMFVTGNLRGEVTARDPLTGCVVWSTILGRAIEALLPMPDAGGALVVATADGAVIRVRRPTA